jgi:hypothetical protein
MPLRLLLLGVAVVGLGGAAPARAVTSFQLALDPAQSVATPEAGSPQALSGFVRIDLDALPLSAPARFQIGRVAVGAAGQPRSIHLDGDLPSAGLGVLQPDGSFLVPTLFLTLTTDGPPQDLAIPNVAGTLELDASGLSVTRLESSLQTDSLGVPGVVSVSIVATPEPGAGALAAIAALTLFVCRAVRRGAGGGR